LVLAQFANTEHEHIHNTGEMQMVGRCMCGPGLPSRRDDFFIHALMELIMKASNLRFAVGILLATGASLSNAAYFDLQTGIPGERNGGQVSITSTSAVFTTPEFFFKNPSSRPPATGLYIGNVTDLTSFEYRLSDSGFIPQIFTNFGMLDPLAPTSSGFSTYHFSNPYSGFLNINYGPFDTRPAGLFSIRNLALGSAVSPVPEPETYAMLLAGLGVMGAIARRRKPSARPA
jgi:hypothetical protein